MRLTYPWWGVLAAVLGGLVGVTAVAAAGGEQFIPLLVTREGAIRFVQIPRFNGMIAYLTLLNERDGGIGGVADKPTVRDWDILEGEALDDALNEFAWDLGGYDDIHATARYRRELVRRLGRRVIEEAKSCRD